MPAEVKQGRLPALGTPVVSAIQPGLHLPFNSRLAAGTPPFTRTAVFLDRDGVIVKDVHFLREPAQIEILRDAPPALRCLQDRFLLIVATNQSGIARGFFTEQNLLEIHAELVRRLSAAGVLLDAFYYCPHLPGSAIFPYGTECRCRKPEPGLLLRAAAAWGLDLASSFMIGDRLRDIEAGKAAGLAGSILLRGAAEHARDCLLVAEDLPQAARLLLAPSEANRR